MPDIRLPRAFTCLGLALALGACTTADPKLPDAASIPLPQPSPRLAAVELVPQQKSSDKSVDGLISKYSVAYAVPESLVRRVVQRESRFNPSARNGPYWGLMQMLPATARGLGHDGSAKDLLDAETNLKFGVKYLAGAYKVADYNPDQAVRLYSRGYYYQAKRKGMLDVLKPGPAKDETAPVVAANAAPAGSMASPAGETPMTEISAPGSTARLAYADERVVLPSSVPLPFERPELVNAVTPSTSGGNGAQARVPAPL
jgi:soluble lytic murein transglycosylase-like protein